MKDSHFVRSVFFILFVVSGFSGLIYQSIWSHYLKSFLGHASYAQVLVIAIFMGGMALGAAVAARISDKNNNLILAYAAVELIIGIMGLLFHDVFISIYQYIIETVFPAMGLSWQVHTIKWIIAGILILPQSILLGATFPLLTAGLIRRYPSHSGKTLASLYFTNSLGAAIGVLVNAFYLIPAMGLPGAVMTAAMLNIFLALSIYFLSREDYYPPMQKTIDINVANDTSLFSSISVNYLFVIAALTGLASFMYEISWIRMLTMVLGASTHSFEIMLSAFILGLAIGGILIRQHIDHIKNPVLVLGILQLLMGMFAMMSIPIYNLSFELMDVLLKALAKTDEGYFLYGISSYLICLMIMLPVTICAGTTLPLITHIALQKTQGDSSIGKIYSWNTVGSIIGVVTAVVIIMPALGLKYVVGIGAIIDFSLGVFLIVSANGISRKLIAPIKFAPVLFACLLILPFFSLDLNRLTSGVFRYGYDDSVEKNVIFYKDGKTSSVAVTETPELLTIFSNGKPEAGIRPLPDGPYDFEDDRTTMVLAGTLPYIYSPDAQYIANIGLGSGMTSHTLLNYSGLKVLDNIEIEQAVYDATYKFEKYVSNLFTDSRSQLHIEDAKTFFAASGTQYDAIVSEPSNPWVSGVSSLFTTEFYREIKLYLKPEGVLVQWIQAYEISPYLISTIYHALRKNFKYVHLYQIGFSDFSFVSSNEPLISDYSAPFRDPAFKSALQQLGMSGDTDIQERKISDEGKLDLYFASFGVSVNSTFFPILDIGAPASRFKEDDALSLFKLNQTPILDPLLYKDPIKWKSSTDNMKMYYAAEFERALQIYYATHVDEVSVDYPSNALTYNDRLMVNRINQDCLENGFEEDNKRHNLISQDVRQTILLLQKFLDKKPLSEYLQSLFICNQSLDVQSQALLASQMAFSGDDYAIANSLSKTYFINNGISDSLVDIHLLKIFVASSIASNKPIAATIIASLFDDPKFKDLELRSLLVMHQSAFHSTP